MHKPSGGEFRFWCQKVLPLVYDDSLSYYELLCKVVDYLNKEAEDIRLLAGDIESLEDSYAQLQSFVENYFVNLDVQEEINKKLDQMASDGTLLAILAPITNSLTERVNEQEEYNRETRNTVFQSIVEQTEYNTQTRHIAENLIGHPYTASTAGEMSDTNKIYVYTGTTTATLTNGHWYYYNGTAWVDGGIYNSAAVSCDTTLSIPDTPADAAAVGLQFTKVKNNLSLYNSLGTLLTSGTFANSIEQGVTYTWAGNTCLAVGTAVGVSLNHVFRSENSFPFGVFPGNTYYVECTTTNPNLYMEIRYFIGDTSYFLQRITSNTEITIPVDATGLWVRIRTETGATVNDTITADILTEPSNKTLAEQADRNDVDVNILKQSLRDYNSCGAMLYDGTFVDHVSEGITYSFTDNVCRAVGTCTGVSWVNIYEDKTKMPYGLSAGKTYNVLCSTTNTHLYAEVRYYIGNNSTFLARVTGNQEITIPSNADGFWVRFRVDNGETVDATIKFDIVTQPTNEALSAEIAARTRKAVNVDTDFYASCAQSFDPVPDGTYSLINDMPTNSGIYVNTAKIVPSEIQPVNPGATYIEKISWKGFSHYRTQRNGDGREQLGFYSQGAMQWFTKSAKESLRIAMFGDSITRGIIGGGSGSTVAPKNIPYFVALENGVITTNFGVGSIGWIQKPYIDYNAEEYVQTVDLTGYDVATLMYGMNDSTGVLGTFEDTTEQTIMGAVYRVISYLMTEYPNLQIILISPSLSKSSLGVFPGWGYTMMRGSSAPYWNFEMMLEEYEKFGKRYHVPVIDGGKCFNSWNVENLLGDNVHPTVEGYRVAGRYFAGEIGKLI